MKCCGRPPLMILHHELATHLRALLISVFYSLLKATVMSTLPSAAPGYYQITYVA